MFDVVDNDIICLILAKSQFEDKLALVSRTWHYTIVTNPDTFPRFVFLRGGVAFPSTITWCRRVQCIETLVANPSGTSWIPESDRTSKAYDVNDATIASVVKACPLLTHLMQCTVSH